MTKIFLAAALFASLASPALAGDKAEKHFSRDGMTYVYTTVAKPDRVVISGRRFPEGSAFELVVRGDQVTGVSGGQPVSFTYKDAQAKLTAQQLASR